MHHTNIRRHFEWFLSLNWRCLPVYGENMSTHERWEKWEEILLGPMTKALIQTARKFRTQSDNTKMPPKLRLHTIADRLRATGLQDQIRPNNAKSV